jgi:hypothetical protein
VHVHPIFENMWCPYGLGLRCRFLSYVPKIVVQYHSDRGRFRKSDSHGRVQDPGCWTHGQTTMRIFTTGMVAMCVANTMDRSHATTTSAQSSVWKRWSSSTGKKVGRKDNPVGGVHWGSLRSPATILLPTGRSVTRIVCSSKRPARKGPFFRRTLAPANGITSGSGGV